MRHRARCRGPTQHDRAAVAVHMLVVIRGDRPLRALRQVRRVEFEAVDDRRIRARGRAVAERGVSDHHVLPRERVEFHVARRDVVVVRHLRARRHARDLHCAVHRDADRARCRRCRARERIVISRESVMPRREAREHDLDHAVAARHVLHIHAVEREERTVINREFIPVRIELRPRRACTPEQHADIAQRARWIRGIELPLDEVRCRRVRAQRVATQVHLQPRPHRAGGHHGHIIVYARRVPRRVARGERHHCGAEAARGAGGRTLRDARHTDIVGRCRLIRVIGQRRCPARARDECERKEAAAWCGDRRRSAISHRQHRRIARHRAGRIRGRHRVVPGVRHRRARNRVARTRRAADRHAISIPLEGRRRQRRRRDRERRALPHVDARARRLRRDDRRVVHRERRGAARRGAPRIRRHETIQTGVGNLRAADRVARRRSGSRRTRDVREVCAAV